MAEKKRRQMWVDVAQENLVVFGQNEFPLKDIGRNNELEGASEMTEDDQAKKAEIEKLIARRKELKQVSFMTDKLDCIIMNLQQSVQS